MGTLRGDTTEEIGFVCLRCAFSISGELENHDDGRCKKCGSELKMCNVSKSISKDPILEIAES